MILHLTSIGVGVASNATVSELRQLYSANRSKINAEANIATADNEESETEAGDGKELIDAANGATTDLCLAF